MIVKYIDTCPKCGQADPWRLRSPSGQCGRTIVLGGERRKYVFCRRCGCKETIVYRFKGR